jgi:acetyl-CoA acetyltransferase
VNKVASVRDICVVGVGNTEYGVFPELDTYTLGVMAFKNALNDCGLSKNDIDGLIVNRIPSYLVFGAQVGINPSFIAQFPAEGRMCGLSIQTAIMALETKQANYIALVYSNNGRSKGAKYGGNMDMWSPFGMTSPGARHALMFQRHMHEYGTTNEQLSAIPIAFRKHAQLNPNAVKKSTLTKNDYLNSRLIVSPLHLNDYCLINDGAVCLILTTAERAKQLKKPLVSIKSIGSHGSLVESSLPPRDYWYSSMEKISEYIYKDANIEQKSIDGLMIYDNFSPTVLFSYEGFGFCPKGEGGNWIQNGRIELNGEFPTNTSGGHLSESYMQGWALNVEAVRQLRGECGERQIENANFMQYIAATPYVTSIIYGR